MYTPGVGRVHKSERAATKEARSVIQGMNSPKDWVATFAIHRSRHGAEYDGFVPALVTKDALPRVHVVLGQTQKFWMAKSSDTAGLNEGDEDCASGSNAQEAVDNMLRIYRDRVLGLLKQSMDLTAQIGVN